ncbi:MAG TPA: pantoate--beta-alanine ligase, partial [Chitinophagaceae bacterium]
PAIYQTLSFIKNNLQQGSLLGLKTTATSMLVAKGFKPDYIEIADASTLELTDQWNGKQGLVALAAAFLNEVRLIDNLIISPKDGKVGRH